LTHSICYSLERQTVAEQIKQLAKSKEGFVAMVSHELRNPLSTINLSVKLLLDRLGGTISEVDRELFSVADRSIDRMIRLTNDVLDFEALESGKITFATQRNDMAEVLSEVHKVMLPAARKKGVGLSVNAEQNLPPVNFDRDRIFQVLLNLVGNAIKCTEKGSVTMTAKTEDGGMHIAVQDTGSGMSPEEMPKLFHNFGQLKNCPAGGTGLGLAISKDIIELHGGRIWAESEKGKGSIFHFILPLLHIDYPLADETVKRGRYTIRISGGTEECHVAIDDGGWQSCRSADGYSWYDWCPTETRAHRISARTRIGNKLVETEKTCSVV